MTELTEEIAEKVQVRCAQLNQTPVGELLVLVREACDRIESAERGLTGAGVIQDHAVLMAAVGLNLAGRSVVAEDILYKEGEG